MKNIILLMLGVLIAASSCEKKDTQAPLVKIIGDNPMIVSLNTAQITDPGATAKDDEDGDLTSAIQTESNVNLNKKGGYSIRYYVKDNAGNTGEAYRGVNVVNRAEFLAKKYNVNDNKVDPQGTPIISNFTDQIVTSDSINDRFIVSKFGNHVNGTVYINRTGNLLSIPQQELTCGDPPVFRRFLGTGTILDSTQFVVNYTETIGSTVYTGSSTYVRR
ncbi:MAG: DUF5011 domain-containing protein [Lentimicrobiaceae bacterium]|nr:DUF5011 domain-containing protein [Lentimicrobiaceae bacterium]